VNFDFWKRRDQDLEDEIQGHLHMAALDRVDRGETFEEAQASARKEMGNAGLIKEVTREIWGWAALERLLQDLRFGARMLRKNPGSTLVAMLTLALGIGASTAIFSVVYGVLLRPLDYEKPEQIVRVSEVNDKGGAMQLADPNFQDLREQNHVLQGLAEYASIPESISGGSEPQRLIVAHVSSDFLSIMRVHPVMGHAFLREDQHYGAAPVVLVSHNYWRQSLNATHELSSVKVKVGDRSCQVIGVLPPGFRLPDDADLWLPRELSPVLPARNAHNWRGIGRLRDGVSLQQARIDISAIAWRLKQQYGRDTLMKDAAVVPLQVAMTSDVHRTLMILLGAVGFLLLVGCANVMNLLLAQASARAGELAVRTALGASRGRLVRQFLAETLMLSLTGGAMGVLAAYYGVRALVAAAPPDTPRLAEVSVAWPVLLFAFGLSVLVAVGLGIFTALRSTTHEVRAALMEGGRAQAGAASARLGRAIIAAQLSMTLVLLVGAGLLGRSLLRVLSVDPGFRTEQILTMDLPLSSANSAGDKIRRVQFLSELFRQLRALPGVLEVGGTDHLPLEGAHLSDGGFALINPQQLSPAMLDLIHRSASADLSKVDPKMLGDLDGFFSGLFHDTARTGYADFVVASEGYFRALGIPLLRGRLFDDRDSIDAPHVALISESLALARWPNLDPIGQVIEFGNMDGDLRLLTITGVVGDIRGHSLEGPPRPTVYVNYRQRPQRTDGFSVVVRTQGDTADLLPQARSIARDLDPNVPPNFNTFTRVLAASLHTRRFNLLLVGIFAGAALVLAVIGIYGVLAYSVARRTRELGVRMALGANSSNVVGLVLRQAMLTAAAGVAAGILGSFALTRTVRSLLFEISPTDPGTFVSVTFLLMLAAALAAYIPARRATKVDPIIALRHE